MRFRGLEMPDDLIDAAQNGQLVVFAGAGVSMQPGAKMPNFDTLVDEIEVIAGYTPDQSGIDFDARLGRLHKEGVDIYGICASILSGYGNVTSDLHRSIFTIFPEDTIRIVTTNFDNCFEKALEEKGLSLELYHAPALPLGDDFQGLVHIHGHIDDPQRQILSDVDFGEAYVTKSWASRFLSDVFSAYTVLFIGYSCGDSLVDYLTRSLSADKNTKVYVLTRSGDDEIAWRDRGVKIIQYQDHAQLPPLFQDWGEHMQKNLNDHREKIKAIVSAPLMPEDYDEDYLLDAFSPDRSEIRDVKLETFVKYATGDRYLLWAAEKGCLTPLFCDSDDPVSREVTLWIAREYAIKSYQTVLAIKAREGHNFSTRFLEEIFLQIANCPEDLKKPVGAWLPLIKSSKARYSSIGICKILERHGKHPGLATLLLSMLFDVRVRIEEPFFGEEPLPKTVLSGGTIYSENYTILEAVKIGGISTIQLLIASLEMASLFNTQSYTAEDEFDSLSFGRQAIEPHEQDEHSSNDLYVLLDLLRDVSIWLKDNDALLFDSIIRQCQTSPATLLKRLGLFLLGISDESADRKLSHIIENDLLGSYHLHHELYTLLQSAFPNAGKSAQERLIGYAKLFYKKEESRSSDYALFNLLEWLSATDPTSAITEEAITTIRQEHPDFTVRENPDLTFWSVSDMSDFSLPESKIANASYDDLIEYLEKPSEVVTFCTEYDIKHTISKIANKDSTWAINQFAQARERGFEGVNVTIAIALAEGLNWQERFENDFESASLMLASVPLTSEGLRPICRTISRLAQHAEESNWDEEQWNDIKNLALKFWESTITCGKSVYIETRRVSG